MARVVMALDRYEQVDVQRKARERGIEFGNDCSDDAGRLQPPHAVQRCGRGEAHKPRELDVGAIGIDLQLFEQLEIN